MLSKAKTLQGYRLDSLDGEVGKVREFYFDDHYWNIRYLVANTGPWLAGRQVLIAPFALVRIEREDKCIGIDLTREQIEKSPSLDSDKPVSRQFERDYYEYYGWPTYWGGLYDWPSHPGSAAHQERWHRFIQGDKPWDPNLRSTHAVAGYHVQASDGAIGHVEDFIIDDDKWSIRYLVVNTGNWWPGKHVLISPHWIERISWGESKAHLNLTREAILKSPEYKASTLLNREYEVKLHGHFNREGYWVEGLLPE